jgi:hypothetical protein
MATSRIARASLLFVLSFTVTFAGKKQTAISIPAGSKIFVDTNNGFDTFILAALQNKNVNLRLVPTTDTADYILDSSLFHNAEALVTGDVAKAGHSSEAAFKLTTKSGDIVWAYAVSKGIFSRGKQSVAEACAKHLKEIVK